MHTLALVSRFREFMVRVSLPFGAYQFALWQSKAIGMLEGMMLRYSRIVHLHIAVVHEGDLIRVSGRSGAMEGNGRHPTSLIATELL